MLETMWRQILDWRQIYIQVLLISAVTSVISGAVFVNENIRIAQAEYDRNLVEVREVSALLAPLVDDFDLISIQAIGNILTARTYINEVAIYRKAGYVMYRSGGLRHSDAAFDDRRIPITLTTADGTAIRVGTLFVQIRRLDDFRLYADAFEAALIFFLTIILVGAVTTFAYAQRSIARPLRQLQEAMETTLTLGQPVATETTKAGFIGKFQDQFNRMQARLLRAQVELEGKSLDLEASSNLIREVLNSIRQSVRLYAPPNVTDFGGGNFTFPFPDRPPRSVGDFCGFLAAQPGVPAFEVMPSTGGQALPGTILFDVVLRAEDGSWLNAKSVRLPTNCHALLITDITAAKELELSLQQAQKMEVVASLTSGIAHDFNNLLAIIVGNLELIRGHPKDAFEVRQNAQNALNASRRAAAIVTSLLSFSKRKPERPISVPIAKVLDEVATIAKTSIGSNFTLITHAAVDAVVVVDLTSLESSLINLIVNARDAMPDGGAIRLLARMASAEELQQKGIVPDRPYLVASVRDEGTGIPAELRDKITASFFTTKKHGTGLGLAMVASFAGQAGGRLVFDNNAGRGATVSLILPCTLNASQALRSMTEIPRRPPRSTTGARVMFIEDEPLLLKVTSRLLSQAGYHCIECAGIGDVRDYLADGGRIPDIVFTDLNLSDGSGRDILGPGFSALRPVPKVLVSGNMEISGLAVETVGFEEVCLKPVEIVVLCEIIERLTGGLREARGRT